MKIDKRLIFLFFFILILTAEPVFGQSSELLNKYIKTETGTSILNLLESIESESGYSVNYSPGQIDLAKILYFKLRNSTINTVLETISKEENLEFFVSGRNIYIIKNYSQKNEKNTDISISGFLRDFQTGEALIGATIRTEDSKYGQYSDHKGYFNLKIPAESENIILSYIGYDPVMINKSHYKSGVLGNIFMKGTVILDEVIVKDSLFNTAQEIRDFGKEKTSYDVSDKITKYGIDDVFNDLIMKPGIHKINDFQGGLSVNGSSPGDNIYYLDGIRIFEPNHIFGLFSSFGSKPVRKVSFFSNIIPVNYSGAFSSVMDFHTREGNLQKSEFDVAITNSAANFFMTAPLRKNVTSFFIDYRHSLLGFYLPNLIKNYKDVDFKKMFFNDLNVKISHKINLFNSINAFYYQGNDHINISTVNPENLMNTNDFKWQNRTMGIFWSYIYKDDIKSDFSLSLSSYNNDSHSDFEIFSDQDINQYLNIYAATKLREIAVKHDFTYYNKRSKVKFGYNFSRFNHSPFITGVLSAISDVPVSIEQDKDSVLNNAIVYLSGHVYFSKNVELKTGFQSGIIYNSFFNKKYINPQLVLSFKISDSRYFDIGFSGNNKFLHSLGSYAVGIPSMLWISSDNDIPVSKVNTFTMNYFWKSKNYQLRTELYYRSIGNSILYANVIDSYNPIASKNTIIPVFLNTQKISDNISIGNSIGYGVNVTGEIDFNKFKSTLSFSINKTKEKHDDLNNGTYFKGKYNVDYSTSVSLLYIFKRINLFADWKYHSGQPFTLPVFLVNSNDGQQILDYNMPNNANLSDYTSLDVGLNKNIKFKKIFGKFSIGITNLLNSFNPVYAYVFKTGSKYSVSEVRGIPFFPYISMDLKF